MRDTASYLLDVLRLQDPDQTLDAIEARFVDEILQPVMMASAQASDTSHRRFAPCNDNLQAHLASAGVQLPGKAHLRLMQQHLAHAAYHHTHTLLRN